MTQTISIKDTRDKLADIIDQVAFEGDVFVITKFGKPKAMIVPVSKTTGKNTSGIEESFGAWADRDDIKDSKEWVRNLRAKMSTRQHA